MEEHKTCSFFGHRQLILSEELMQKIRDTIKKLILYNNVKIFLFGSNSKFNNICHCIVTDLKKEYPQIKRIVYTLKSEAYIKKEEKESKEKILSHFMGKDINLLDFDEEFNYKSKYTSGKACYVERNQAMIDDSDYCIFYYDINYKPPLRKYSKVSDVYYQPKSGTEIAYKYACKKKKILINLA